MRKDKEKLTKRQIALLHVAKKELHLDEPNYRAVLSVYGGAESAKEMTRGGFMRVMKYLTERLGFEAPIFTEQNRKRDAKALVLPGQANKMIELYQALGMDTAERQQGLCRRVIKKPWAQTREEANKVIECLKAMKARRPERP